MKILNPPIRVTSQIIVFLFECTKRKKGCSQREILDYIGKTETYVLSALEFLKVQSIVIEKNDKYFLSEKILRGFDGNQNSANNIIKNTFVNNKLFVEYTYFLSKGLNPDQSAKTIKSIYQIGNNESTIVKIFSDWIKFLNIKINLKPNRNKVIESLEATTNTLQANKFLKEEFRDFYNEISPDVLKDLRDAIINLKSKREESINDSGRALEDFLRMDLAPNFNLKKCSGIVQITNELNKHPEFPTKLNNIASSLGNVRSMGKAHGVDAKLKQRWDITETAAISYITMIICLMKSYLEYKNNKKTIF